MHIKIDLNKNTKLSYYTISLIKYLTPRFYYQHKLKSLLADFDNKEEIENRVNYYNKINTTFVLDKTFTSINKFKKEKMKTYFFDLMEYLQYFNINLKISYLFGDITHIPKVPTLLKSRPITGDNKNSVLMKLNKVRHFIFLDDKINFEEKQNLLVWRGKCFTQHRIDFLKEFHNKPYCNVGQINKKDNSNIAWQKEKMKISQQLQYKFILTIEGNDVASNLKWVMSSNSIAFMVKPKFETWFMEGTLIPNHHYVLLKDDYSDLEEKINYYSKNLEESITIIKNANNYVAQFKNKKQENLISLLVLKKYFEKSNQLI